MTLFSRTSNPFLPSIRVRVVPFSVVHLSPARTGPSQFTVSLCRTPPSLVPELVTSHAVWPQRPWVASIVCRAVMGLMPTILASPARQPISTWCGLVKPMTQILDSPIGNCLSLPVLFHLLFWVPYLDAVLLFHDYFGPTGVPTYTPSYSILESFAGPSCLYGCGQADWSPFRISPLRALSLSTSTYTSANKAGMGPLS
ncbi:unnamed protein product [Acanthosepion pharaonis]|uniref:Uncharacterized protein n=1 Tax=Acanthosepion pharaonis TaxID=158019 RepID=A0A812E8X5_ACAPH|nr:unnamed protein product [Sepia pharaonis]